jgi:carboxyl-terminal processing protease
MKKSVFSRVFILVSVLVLSLLAGVGVLARDSDPWSSVRSWISSPKVMLASSTPSAPGHTLAKNPILTCPAVRDRAQDFLRVHFLFRTFTEELSSRTFNKYFQMLDPGKNFFTAADVDQFRSFERTLPVQLARLDCKFIDNVYDLFRKRVAESSVYFDGALAHAFEYSANEKIETDRKKVAWAASVDELRERWKKQVKFLALSMKEAEPKKEVIIEKLRKRHVLLMKSVNERSADEVNGYFLNAFSLSLDPHSSFQLPEAQEEFKVAFSLQLVGIGAQLLSIDGFTVIDGLIPGGPADRDGRLQKQDKIVAVDAGASEGYVDVVDMDLSKVVQLIRGKKDTVVKLRILRKDDAGAVKNLTIELTRDVVNLPDGAAKSEVTEVDGKKIGVIELPSFYIDYQGSKQGNGDYRSSANDVARELIKLREQKVDGIVLDLRSNGGGDLGECVRMTGLFIDTGSVVQVQDRNGDSESLDDRQVGTLWDGPLAVLISKQSASASEILAGALRDYGRAVIVGNSRTYGKATVQHVVEVPGTRGRDINGALKVTVSKFFHPSGDTNQAQGVKSHVVIPDVLEPMPIGEEENEYVLPRTKIPPARSFSALRDLGLIAPELQKRSATRVAKSKEFQELIPLIQKAEKERDNTEFPLQPEQELPTALNKKKKGAKEPNGKKPDGKKSDDKKGGKSPLDPRKVINAEDIQLFEAARILNDATAMLGQSNWVK